MEVIGAGFGRTGTMSLKVALEELAFAAVIGGVLLLSLALFHLLTRRHTSGRP